MSELLKLDAARDLVVRGDVKQAHIIGLPGGWKVQLQTYNREAVLATKANAPRRFGSFEGALKVLCELGVRLDLLSVDARQWKADDRLGTKRCPNRSADMKLNDQDAHYAAFLRASVLDARADARPALSSSAAKKHMDAIKIQHRAQFNSGL